MKLTLIHKLGASYILMACSLLVCAIVGFSAAVSLSSTLNFITNNAWDAADGAMEGTIEIEAELLVLNDILLNVVSVEEGLKAIEESSDSAEEALGRMAASGLMDDDAVAELNEKLAEFRGHREHIIMSHKNLNASKQAAAQSVDDFDGLLSDLEEVIEVKLENSDLRYMTAEDLMPLWDVANATMEARLNLLIRSQAFNLLLSGNEVEAQKEKMETGLAQAKDRLEMIYNSSYANEKAPNGQTYQQAITKMLGKHEAIYAKSVKDYLGFVMLKKMLDGMISDILAQIGEIEEQGDETIEGTVDEIADTIFYAESSIIVSTIFGVLLAIAAFFYANNVIVKPIRDIAQRLTGIGEEGGDLTQRLEAKGQDEIAQLSNGFNRFVEKISEIMSTVKNSSTQVANSASELSSVTALASEGASKQSGETSAIAAAIEEMSTSAEQVNESASIAAEETSNADASAKQGKTIVSQAISGIQTLSGDVSTAADVINNLEQEAESIGSVLDVIRGIAEQTNLLALNAAIEAARAGEQGRGFAVVADEVRTLASRTQQSTEEIQGMIESLQTGTKKAVSEMEKSRKQAESTVEMASTAGQSLDSIVAAVAQINSTNSQIAHAADEQRKTAAEVSKNVLSIRNVSEQTAENSKQAQDTSGRVAEQAALLQNMMQQFQT